MRKFHFVYAFASLALVACTSDEFFGDVDVNEDIKGDFIGFSSASGRITRAEITGSDAAAKLGNNFVVEGTKGSADSKSIADKVVFDNYNVNYLGAASVNTTQSNTAGWEYVNQAVNPNSGASKQSIKYWDYSAKQYNFIAYSAGTSTGAKISAITPATATDKEAGAFTVEGTASQIGAIYLAELKSVVRDDFGSTVDLKFCNANAKVTVGLYETVPGYSIQKVKFYDSEGINGNNATLYSSEENITGGGKYVVYYGKDADGNIQPEPLMNCVSSTGKTKDVVLGGLTYKDDVLGTASSYATKSPELSVFPVAADDARALTLRVDYTLVSDDGSKEEILVQNARAVVPVQYTAWKSNYSYTYLFKISSNTNGTTGDPGDPEGLYPITFDAVVESEIIGTQSTITTVATPSVTTYNENSKFGTDDEYQAGKIVVRVQDGFDAADGVVYEIDATSATDEVNEATISDVFSKNASTSTTEIVGKNGIKLISPIEVATYVPASPLYDAGTVLAAGESLDGYYTKDTDDVYTACDPADVADGTTTYYKKNADVKVAGLGEFTAVAGKTYVYVLEYETGKYAIKVIKVM